MHIIWVISLDMVSTGYALWYAWDRLDQQQSQHSHWCTWELYVHITGDFNYINLETTTPPKTVTWILLYPRKSFSSLTKDCNLPSSLSLFSSRWRVSRELGLAKALSLNARMRLWSTTSSWRTIKLSSPSTWLISFPKQLRHAAWAPTSRIKVYVTVFI